MERVSKKIKNGEYKEIKSLFGHDGFLIEYTQLENCLIEWRITQIINKATKNQDNGNQKEKSVE